ncbi:mitochondrial 37S ribosomal protein bS21m [Aspergillus homomorphus CBS 101889]|uniref:Ribosomal protein S21 n=1 Tax=Aspergillus homomorphus (strain CBS 101889) TaxID=1450537 RepID=A0A395HXW0_ASPHC|nr:hypothetical protein BO97DRAFT_406063 [Aspergillus homomorphus CBS 101889]RAL11698.1 hypothetical protein BO97DRAFT_406063 [Aspergillus homomorphus CBS 101889]
MEMRILSQCLRATARPTTTTSLLYTKQFARQSLPAIRYNSSSSSSPKSIFPTSRSTFPNLFNKDSKFSRSQSTPKPQESASGNEFDDIIKNLNFAGKSSSSVDGASSPYGADVDSMRPDQKFELKLGPTLGRRVEVDKTKGADLGSSIRTLQYNLRGNNVPFMVNAQKQYTRKGQRRKVIRRLRWRRLFKYSFKATLEKVRTMRDQGW